MNLGYMFFFSQCRLEKLLIYRLLLTYLCFQKLHFHKYRVSSSERRISSQNQIRPFSEMSVIQNGIVGEHEQ